MIILRNRLDHNGVKPMQRFRKILVGVDLSHADHLAAIELNPPTQESVNRAIWLAEELSAELTFFSAIDVSAHTQELLHTAYEQASQNVEQQAGQVLQDLVSRAKGKNIEANYKLVFGLPWEETIRQVLRNKHDLVIVGTRDHSRAGRLLFGSTGMKLLRNCPCPVWVTRPEELPEEFNILVASDFSDVSQLALEIAISSSQLTDAKVTLLHALDTHLGQKMLLTGLRPEELQDFLTNLREQAEHKLHDQLSQTDYRTLTHGVRGDVVEGPADVVILDAIEEQQIDLLVMGTIARSGISGMLIGNSAEQLLTQVPCSVLAVKPSDFECPVELDD
jgi:universal stress protein E